jgi:hypothetical protein
MNCIGKIQREFFVMLRLFSFWIHYDIDFTLDLVG